MINMPNDITLKSVRNLLGMKFFIPSYNVVIAGPNNK